jgi:2-amino-4,5-dihydroxy-6-oxo-7-(phosphooxy)heptanoate synthase
MMGTTHFARSLRLCRLSHPGSGGLMVTPLDHSISDGPIATPGGSLSNLASKLAASGVDAIVVHKGSLRHIDPAVFREMSLILHLSASTSRAPDPDAKYIVTEVEEAVRLGADAVSVHVNMGSTDERRQVGDLGRIADACDRWNMPLMAMMYARGPQIVDPRDPVVVAHAVAVAADLGADIVKTTCLRTVAEMTELTATSPVPVLAAGGPRRDSERDVLAFVSDALSGGAAGVAMGRNIFQASRPEWLAREVARLIHEFQGTDVERWAGRQGDADREAVLA